MPERSEFERKLHDEQLAMRRCLTALEKVDDAAKRRILAWLLNTYAPTEETKCVRCEDLAAAAPYLIAEGRRRARREIAIELRQSATIMEPTLADSYRGIADFLDGSVVMAEPDLHTTTPPTTASDVLAGMLALTLDKAMQRLQNGHSAGSREAAGLVESPETQLAIAVARQARGES